MFFERNRFSLKYHRKRHRIIYFVIIDDVESVYEVFEQRKFDITR